MGKNPENPIKQGFLLWITVDNSVDSVDFSCELYTKCLFRHVSDFCHNSFVAQILHKRPSLDDLRKTVQKAGTSFFVLAYRVYFCYTFRCINMYVYWSDRV